MNTFYQNKSQEPKAKGSNRFSRVFFILFTFHFSLFTFSQVKDTTKINRLDEVLVAAVRVTEKTPVSFSNLNKKDIKFRNLGQDIPILMNYLPSVVTTSDTLVFVFVVAMPQGLM
jgi:iron complex outermembrane receptor protein